MKEITFLKQNHEKWLQFEALLDSHQRRDPDALADLFIRITDDLSWAHTFYPGSNTEKYLNDLAARIHQEIYKNKKEKRSRLVSFWAEELPRLMGRQRLNLLITFLIFGISVWIGVVSASHDENFVRLILGDGYVDETLQRMRDGNPLGVYQSENHFVMFLFIAINNARVALICIVFGMLGWIGVSYMQFRNGVMLGAFFYFLCSHGFAHEATLTVWIHGVIEIWCIVVAGAAGMALGNGLWFPGAYPRGVAFMRGAREALKIGVGLIPFFFLAAFFEGFITRYVGLSDYLRMAIIGVSLIFVTYYFVIYPFALEYKRPGNKKPMKKFWVVMLIIFSVAVPFTIRGFLTMLKRDKLAGGEAEKSFWDNKFYMNPRSAFLFLLGIVLTLLPVIALIGHAVTGDKNDPVAIGFFVICFMLAGFAHARAFKWLTETEEEDLVITRKNSAKADIYERNSSTTPV